MKWWFFFLIIVYSCGSNSSASLSQDQQGLFALSDDFKMDYKKANNSLDRESLVNNYELKLQQYLTYTCDSSLKNIKVRMTKLEENPAVGMVHAEFKDKNCSYVFHQVYDSTKQMKEDVVYQFVKSLQQNKEVSVRFLYAGNLKIKAPEGSLPVNFEIEVIPTAIGG